MTKREILEKKLLADMGLDDRADAGISEEIELDNLLDYFDAQENVVKKYFWYRLNNGEITPYGLLKLWFIRDLGEHPAFYEKDEDE